MPVTPPQPGSLSGHVCIDHWRPCTFDPGWVMQGWFLGDRPIRCLVTENAGGMARSGWLGRPRPDVAMAYPQWRHAEGAGFLARVDGDPQFSPPPTGGRWWCEDDEGRWWTFPASWSAREPMPFQQAEYMPEPPSTVVAAAGGCDDPENHFRLAVAASTGIALRLDIINKCNLRCIMCHYQQDAIYRRPARRMTTEEFEKMFAELSPLVSEVVLSCADEPLLSPYFAEIVGLIRRLRPAVAIKFCTNAMLLNAAVRRLLIEKRVDLIVVSMDGATRNTFESIRVGSRFDQVVRNVLALQELRRRTGTTQPEIISNFVMMKRNLHETLPFVSLARELGATTVDFRHVVASHVAFDLQTEQLSNSPGRYNYYRQRLLEAGRVEGMALYLPPAFQDAAPWTPGPDEPSANLKDFREAAEKFEPDVHESPLQMLETAREPPGWLKLYEEFGGTFCPRPFSEITLRDQAEILPCPWHARPLGRLDETPNLLDAFFGEQFQALRRNMLRPDGDPHCADCPLKSKELPDERFT